MSVAARNIIEALRDIVQDFLVPELKVVRVTVEALSAQQKSGTDGSAHQIDSLRAEIKFRGEKLERLVRSGLEKDFVATATLSQKPDKRPAYRDQLAAIGARLPGQ